MRTGLGVAGIQKQNARTARMQEVGTAMKEEEMRKLKEALVVFQKQLEDFASTHAKQINRDPQFRRVCFFLFLLFACYFS